jgi:phosphoribosyl-AMP cyclohydrolase
MIIDEINFKKGGGLVTVVAQHWETKKVLTVAYMNREALEKTLSTGEAYYWSRSKNRLWHKGEGSGHFQYVKEVIADCDSDALLILVDPKGGIACHTGNESCFHTPVTS